MILRGLALATALAMAGSAQAGWVKASSELKDDDGAKHGASLAFDGLLQTGWAEGEVGSGDGSWVEVHLDSVTDVHSVSIWPGNLTKGERSIKEYGRPQNVTITLSGGGEEVTVEERLPDLAKVGPQRIDIPIVGKAKTVRVTIDTALEGYVFPDTYLAEVAVNFVMGHVPSQVSALDGWLTSAAGEKAKTSSKDEVVGLFEKISGEQFGDSESLAVLMDWAADGAPYLRDRVSRTVPYGYRVQAIPPDPVAVDALLKLKDSNAIPAIEMASLRLHGDKAVALAQKAEMFHAYQEMVSGGRRNIQAWGTEGWERGALRGFGEPLAVQVDRFGDVYVADLANHRVQRFGSERGTVDQVWGSPEPDITNVWVEGNRPFYAAGAAPGKGGGQFQLPLDIAMIPGKDGDGFVVLDGTGRVQVFDETGDPLISWDVRSDNRIDAGVGGEAYVEYAKGEIVVIWVDEAFVYSVEGEELSNWVVEDGVPNGTMVFKNGKIGMVFGNQLVMYSTDGFRHGGLLGDELGVGFEAMDATVDEKGKLWIVTDTGWVHKYKRPGKIHYKVPVADFSLKLPRIAAYNDYVYVTERDRILALDALETKSRLEAEAEAAAAEGGE